MWENHHLKKTVLRKKKKKKKYEYKPFDTARVEQHSFGTDFGIYEMSERLNIENMQAKIQDEIDRKNAE